MCREPGLIRRRCCSPPACPLILCSRKENKRLAAMAGRQKFAVALVTTPDLATARRLGRGAVRARLAACANLVPKIESHYRWQGKVETGAEVLVIFKTTAGRLDALEK